MKLETLADYRDGRADAADATRVREHLAGGCAACEQNLLWLQTAAETLRESGRVSVPQPLMERAYAVFRERFRPPARASFLARLTFDSRLAPAPAGARGARSGSYHLVYSTDALDVELWQEPLPDGNWYLIGQALPTEGDDDIVPIGVTLTPAQGESLAIQPAASEFHLPLVPAGVYQMTLHLAEGDTQIPDLRIGQ